MILPLSCHGNLVKQIRDSQPSQEYGLEINCFKMKMMEVDHSNNNRPKINEKYEMQFADHFTYLCSDVDDRGVYEHEISKSIQIVTNAMIKLSRMWKESALSKNTKIKLEFAFSFLNLPLQTRNLDCTTRRAEEDRYRENMALTPYAASLMDSKKNKPYNFRRNCSGQTSIFGNFHQNFEIFRTYNCKQLNSIGKLL